MEEGSTGPNLFEVVRSGSIALGFQAVKVLGYSELLEPNGYEINTVYLKLKRLPHAFSGFHIAQISDIHMGAWMNRERLQHAADLVLTEKPDALVLTGDFLKGRTFTEASRNAIQDMTKVLAPLAARVPSFAVLGNHDYWTNPNAIREMFRRCGITDLTNTVFTLRREGGNLHLCGVDDIRHGDVRLDDVIAQLEDNSAAIL